VWVDEPELPPEWVPPLLCSVVGWWWVEPPPEWLPPPLLPPLLPPEWVGLWVGWCVGCTVVGGAGGGAEVGWMVAVGVLVGPTVAVGVLVGDGVLCVGAAAAALIGATSPEAPALWGHHATRQAATPSNAATAKRTAFVQVLLTTPS
jgi:hypothetical protein